jgi:Uncharacterized membrane protein, required for colicin V production
MSLSDLPINLFDLVLIVILVVGVLRGRKNGMSEELLSLATWLFVVFVCALAYEPLGKLIADSSRVFSLLNCYILAYVAAGIGVLLAFTFVKRGLGGKLIGSDIFGGAEYYLGMGSGLIRWTCMLLAALALLNARYFSPAEVKAMEAFQDDVYGSNYFPTLHSVQAAVFERSLVGPWIRNHLGFFLIKPTTPEKKEIKQKDYQLPS